MQPDDEGYTTTITDVARYRDGGWSWTQLVQHPDDPPGTPLEFRTDGEGKGLFVRSLDDGSWNQVYGTLQYRLTADTPEHAIAQIKSPARRHN
jgi:hypothetical protein